MVNIKDYFITLNEIISEKKLDNFWIICGQKEFKPIHIPRKKIEKIIKEKAKDYRGKYLANIKLLFQPIKDWDKLDSNEWIFTVIIHIYKVSDDGLINTSIYDVWESNIFYNKKELNENHFTFNELMEMIRMAYKRKIVTDMAGITYTNWLANYNRVLDKK